MEKDKLVGLRRVRNLDGIAIIGEKLDGTRIELDRELLVDFIDFLESIDAEVAGVDEANVAKLISEISNVLTISNYEMVIA